MGAHGLGQQRTTGQELRSPESGIRGTRTRRTANRVATHQVHDLLGLDELLAEARANLAEPQKPPRLSTPVARWSSPRHPGASSPSSTAVIRSAIWGNLPSIMAMASAQDAQYAAGAILRADRRPNPPILMGNVANL